MDPQSVANAEKDFERALKELGEGHVLAALACLENALKIRDNPSWHSYLGYCIAKERGHVTKGLELCRASIEREPENSAHYLNLAKVHLVAKNKPEAVQVLRQGMEYPENQEIARLLKQIGTRKPPVIPWLSRDNFLNKYLGILLTRLGLR